MLETDALSDVLFTGQPIQTPSSHLQNRKTEVPNISESCLQDHFCIQKYKTNEADMSFRTQRITTAYKFED